MNCIVFFLCIGELLLIRTDSIIPLKLEIGGVYCIINLRVFLFWLWWQVFINFHRNFGLIDIMSVILFHQFLSLSVSIEIPSYFSLRINASRAEMFLKKGIFIRSLLCIFPTDCQNHLDKISVLHCNCLKSLLI